jgi:acyl carrier protein
MSPDDVLAGLADVLTTVAGVDPADVTPDKAIADDLGIDSLTMVDVVVSAEDRFGLLIPDDDWARFRTVADAADYIARRATDITGVA